MVALVLGVVLYFAIPYFAPTPTQNASATGAASGTPIDSGNDTIQKIPSIMLFICAALCFLRLGYTMLFSGIRSLYFYTKLMNGGPPLSVVVSQDSCNQMYEAMLFAATDWNAQEQAVWSLKGEQATPIQQGQIMTENPLALKVD